MIGRLRGRNAAVELTEEVRFTFDGRPIAAHRGDTIAAALLRAGLRRLRAAPVDGGPRGMFCCMGLCQDCAVLVDDEMVEGCRRTVEEGLAVRSHGATQGTKNDG